jgi:hypothetical protein
VEECAKSFRKQVLVFLYIHIYSCHVGLGWVGLK